MTHKPRDRRTDKRVKWAHLVLRIEALLKKGHTRPEIAGILRVPKRIIYTLVSYYGLLPKRPYVSLSENDKQFIIDHYKTSIHAEIADMLHRSQGTVGSFLRREGLHSKRISMAWSAKDKAKLRDAIVEYNKLSKDFGRFAKSYLPGRTVRAIRMEVYNLGLKVREASK